jgi:hypothetical protein
MKRNPPQNKIVTGFSIYDFFQMPPPFGEFPPLVGGGGAGEVFAFAGLFSKIIIVAAETAIKPVFLIASLREIDLFAALSTTFSTVFLISFILFSFSVFNIRLQVL